MKRIARSLFWILPILGFLGMFSLWGRVVAQIKPEDDIFDDFGGYLACLFISPFFVRFFMCMVITDTKNSTRICIYRKVRNIYKEVRDW